MFRQLSFLFHWFQLHLFVWNYNCLCFSIFDFIQGIQINTFKDFIWSIESRPIQEKVKYKIDKQVSYLN